MRVAAEDEALEKEFEALDEAAAEAGAVAATDAAGSTLTRSDSDLDSLEDGEVPDKGKSLFVTPYTPSRFDIPSPPASDSPFSPVSR